MTLFHVVLLSIVEGITEFLPISSTGHLVLLGSILQIQHTEFTKSFEIIIQLGAISAILFLYGGKFITEKQLLSKVAYAFIPTALVGLLFYGVIKHYLLENPYVVIASLFIGGICIIVLEYVQKNKAEQPLSSQTLTVRQAIAIGIAQSISVIPGVSRSAASIIGGQLSGLTRKQAVEFSFLLAAPTMAAATLLDLVKSDLSHVTVIQWQYLCIGMAVSFITALIVVRFFLRFIEKHTLTSFGIYRIVLAIFMLIVKPF